MISLLITELRVLHWAGVIGGRQVLGLLGHSKLESTVRYLGIEVDDALEISEQIEI